MRSLRSALTFIGCAGVGFGLLIGLILFNNEHNKTPAIDALVFLLPAWAFIGTGLFAWWRRPSNRSGSLMVLVGFAWLLIALSESDNAVLFSIGLLTSNVSWVLLAQLLLVFPGGQFDAPWQRWLIVALWIDAVLMTAVTTLFSGPDLKEFDCSHCLPNPISIADMPRVAMWTDNLATGGGVLLIGVLIVVLARRYRALGPTNRDAIKPVLAAGASTVLMLGLLISLQAAGIDDTAQQTMFALTVVALSTIPFAFVFGLLQSRFSAAGAVSELIAFLGDSPVREIDLRAALADALDDPTLQFAYWLPDRDAFVDESGALIAMPEPRSGRGWTPVEHDGELIAAIVFDDSLEENQKLIRATGSAAALALRNQRLEAELRANVEELRASRARIVQASDAARRALERNLHDGAQQHLVSMALTLRLAQRKIETDPAEATALLARASADLAEATTELRELARGIHPAVLTDRGLGAALDALAARSVVPVVLGEVPEERLPPAIESAAYFVVAEALTNVARYSQATEVSVTVTRVNGRALVEISDDGVGGADIAAGTGLRGLQDRVAALDGRLTITSPRGAGTTISADMPCGS